MKTILCMGFTFLAVALGACTSSVDDTNGGEDKAGETNDALMPAGGGSSCGQPPPGGSLTGAQCCAKYGGKGWINCMPGPDQPAELRQCCQIVQREKTCNIAW